MAAHAGTGRDAFDESVSVIIPTRGTKPELLLRAVRSAASQSFAPVEVVIVVDGPSGAGAAVDATAFPTARVVALGAESGGKPGLVRNFGVSVATGAWVAFLDDDDVWESRKLEKQLEALKEDGTSFCCCRSHGGEAPILHRLFSGDDIASRNRVVCSSVVVSKARLDEISGFGEEKYGQDWRCWQRYLADGRKATFLDEALLRLNEDANDLDRSTVRAETRHAVRSALGGGQKNPAADLIASFGGF